MKRIFLFHFSPGVLQTASYRGGGGSLSAPGEHQQEHSSAERWHKGSTYVRVQTDDGTLVARQDAMCLSTVCHPPLSPPSKVSLTAFPERREAQYGGVPWWIIVLSVLLGLLLLALLAFLLWKVGHTHTRTHIHTIGVHRDFCQISLRKRTIYWMVIEYIF